MHALQMRRRRIWWAVLVLLVGCHQSPANRGDGGGPRDAARDGAAMGGRGGVAGTGGGGGTAPAGAAGHAPPDAAVDAAGQDAGRIVQPDAGPDGGAGGARLDGGAGLDGAAGDAAPVGGSTATDCGPLHFNCAPFACNVDAGSCKSYCVTTADCAAGKPCVAGLCGYREPATCHSDGECASGHCEQGVCCATTCVGPCRSCALLGSTGVCQPVPAGIASTCSFGFACDGQGACRSLTCAADSDCLSSELCGTDHLCRWCAATCSTDADCVTSAHCIHRNACTMCMVPADGGS